MKIFKWAFGSVFLGSILVFGFGNMIVFATEEDEEHESMEQNEHRSSTKSSTIVKDALYAEECGACHMAYPAGLLPQKSWQKIMSNLDQHFDENAEVDAATHQKISRYLSSHAAGNKGSNRLTKMLRNFPSGTPTRITKLPYFIRKHDEIPSRMVKNNPKVGSFSQCDKCHKDAEKGNFNEHQVSIPGYGSWED